MLMFSAILQPEPAMPAIDLLAVVLGGVFLNVGLMSLVAATNRSAKKQIFLALAAFAFLYGSRLLVGGLAPESSGREYALAMISYFILIPATVLVMNILSRRWYRVSLWVIVILCLFAVSGALSDVITRTPFSFKKVGNTLVIVAVLALLGMLVSDARRERERTIRRRILFVGFLLFIAGIVYENIHGLGWVPEGTQTHTYHPVRDIEAVTTAVFLICAMYFAVGEALERQSRLAVMDAELAHAQRIQSGLLPKAMPIIAGAEIAARYLPMQQVAGDFYDFVELSESRFGVLVADVTGHGVAAALVASMIKAAMLIMREHAEAPAELLTRLNTVFCNQLEGQFITAVYAVFDTQKQTLRFSGAGHPPILKWQNASGDGKLLESNGLPLGMFANAHYPVAEAAFHPGDRLLLYTDGLPEAAAADEEQFGVERMQAILQKEPTAAGIVESELFSVRQWRGSSDIEDDLTALAIVNTSRK